MKVQVRPTKQELKEGILLRLNQVALGGSELAKQAAIDVLGDAGNIENDIYQAALLVFDHNWSIDDAVRSTWLTSDTLDEEWAVAEQNKLNAKYAVTQATTKPVIPPFNHTVQSGVDDVDMRPLRKIQGADSMKDVLIAAIHYTVQALIEDTDAALAMRLRELERKLVDEIAGETKPGRLAMSSHDMHGCLNALLKAASIYGQSH